MTDTIERYEVPLSKFHDSSSGDGSRLWLNEERTIFVTLLADGTFVSRARARNSDPWGSPVTHPKRWTP